MNNNWKIISYAMAGVSHMEEGIPCEDFVTSLANEDTCAIVLADGAGSATHSQEGARLVATKCASWIVSHYDSAYKNSEKVLKKRLMMRLRSGISEKAKKLQVDRLELSSTLLFVAIKNGTYISGHIGDGVIGVAVNGNCEVLSDPERGEFANNTFFATTSDLSHLRIQRGNIGSVSSFFLMSDGSADCLYMSSDKKFAPAVSKLTTVLSQDKTVSSEQTSKMLAEMMENHFRARTKDDCSFIMINI